jgi:hypothetical protein
MLCIFFSSLNKNGPQLSIKSNHTYRGQKIPQKNTDDPMQDVLSTKIFFSSILKRISQITNIINT